MFIPPASTSKMLILPDTWLLVVNYALARNITFSINLNTKRRVYLERHGGDVTRVNTALATLGRVHFAFVTIATMPPLVHNLLLCASGALTRFYATVDNVMLQLIFLFFFFFVQRWHRIEKALFIWTAHASITIRYYYTRSRKSKWPEVFAKCQVRWAIITAITTFSDWIRVYA